MEKDFVEIDRQIKLEEADNKFYLSDPITHKMVPVNDTGRFVWQRIQKGFSKRDIIKDLLGTYEGVNADEARKDIDDFVMMLQKLRFISSEDNQRKTNVKLQNISFSITNLCNLNCKHCLAGSTLGKRDEFTFDEIKSIITQMEEMKVGSISLFGGEPMMRRDFFDIVEFCSRSHLGFSLNTNGTLITKEAVKRFKDTRLRGFCVSLDGASKEVHDAFRGEGSFYKTVKGIESLIEENFSVMISTIVTHYNYKDLKNIVELSKRIGARQVRFNSVHYGGNALCFSNEIVLKVKEKFEVFNMLKGLREEYGDFITGSECQVVDIIQGLKAKKPPSLPLVIYPCGAAMSKCSIRPDGYIVPCEILWDVKCGNIRERPLKDIWENDPILNDFRRPILLSKKEIPECEGCKYLRLCYQGHRCSPYYISEKFYEDKEFYCWRETLPEHIPT